MSVKNFNPTWWANQVDQTLKKEFVLSQEPLVNTNYDGLFSESGESVKINQIGAVTAKTYNGTVVYEEMDSSQLILVIDQEDYFGVKYRDLDRAQNFPKLSSAIADEGAFALNDKVDQFVAAKYVDAGVKDAVLGIVGTSVVLDKTTAEQYFTDAFRILSENNVAKAIRNVAVPPWVIQVVNQYFITTLTDNVMEALNGFAGRAFGFNFFESNNLVNDGSDWNIGFTRPPCITLARQIGLVEALRDQDGFNDLLRGYNVYGAKMVRPDQAALGVVKKA